MTKLGRLLDEVCRLQHPRLISQRPGPPIRFSEHLERQVGQHVGVHAEITGQIERIMSNAGYFSDKQIGRSPNRVVDPTGIEISVACPDPARSGLTQRASVS